MQNALHMIDGQMCPASDGGWIEVHNPANAEPIARVAAGTTADIERAVAAAEAAQPAWAALTHTQRAQVLQRIADRLEQRLDEFAELETLDTGKPLWLSRDIEIPRAVTNLRYFAAAVTQFASESHSGEIGLNITLRQPLGVVGCISPWNLPLYLFTWKIAPALAIGNAVVGKPSEITPLTASRCAELCIDAGLPAGVLNIVHGHGDEAGQALVEHPRLRAISFTGSTRVGRGIARLSGERLRKVSLELGGKNASIVFADAPRVGLAASLLRAGWQNSGQICLCGSRLLIQREAYSEVRDALLAEAAHWKVGDPLDPLTRMGPVISQAHFDKVMGAIQRARADGADVLCGGEALRPGGRCDNGWFIAPTLIENLPADSCLHGEEIFGPVIVLQPFDDAEHALRIANASGYGLAASVWTSDLHTAHHVASRVRAGVVWINSWMQRDLRTPFGGTGDSGMGREGGLESLRFFTEPKNLCFPVP